MTTSASLAYLDTFSGLVPCRVDYVSTSGDWDDRTPEHRVAHITLTATRGAYRRGEILAVPVRELVSRRTHVRGGHVRVSSWQPTHPGGVR